MGVARRPLHAAELINRGTRHATASLSGSPKMASVCVGR